MQTKEFDYYLPSEQIAQSPIEPRDASRLMVINKDAGNIEHCVFRDIPDYLKDGDCLVVNNTRVIPARLKGVKAGTGGKVEIFLLAKVGDKIWEALVKPGRRLAPGTRVEIAEGGIMATIQERLAGGERSVSFDCSGDLDKELDNAGEIPLPPYIGKPLSRSEGERYQTIYASEKGSVAAPTAGLHFTPDLISGLNAKGVSVASITLRVGLDTFRPVREEIVENHEMHSEFYSITEEAAQKINETKKAGGRIVAVGTTSVRVLEAAGKAGILKAGTGETRIFIYPGFTFRVTDAMITNFHLPKSTLIMMVSAFGGKELVFNAYSEAIKERYRFYSFGDAMFIL